MKTIRISLILLSVTFWGRVNAQTLEEKNYKDSSEQMFPPSPVAAPAQPTQGTKNQMTDQDREKFADMYIPSIIAKSGMAPAKFDNFGFSFGDDKVNFSTGLAEWLKHSVGLQLNAEAPSGSKTLFQPGAKSYDFGLTLKYTIQNGGTIWYVTNSGRAAGSPQVVSSQRFTWWNFNYASNYSSLNIFSNDTSFTKERNYRFEFLASINGVFNSLFFKHYMHKRLTWSAGFGVARFDNYSTLDEITVHEGIYYPESSRFSEQGSTSGRKGDFKIYTGGIFRGALYKPITSPFAFTNVYLGVTVNYYGLGAGSKILNSNFGIYFSKRHFDDVVETNGASVVTVRKLVEDFSVGLIADFKNLQRTEADHYWKQNFKVLLSAQIPLSFN